MKYDISECKGWEGIEIDTDNIKESVSDIVALCKLSHDIRFLDSLDNVDLLTAIACLLEGNVSIKDLTPNWLQDIFNKFLDPYYSPIRKIYHKIIGLEIVEVKSSARRLKSKFSLMEGEIHYIQKRIV